MSSGRLPTRGPRPSRTAPAPTAPPAAYPAGAGRTPGGPRPKTHQPITREPTTHPRTPTSSTPVPTVTTPTPVRGHNLPLGYSTGSASRVLTVVASSTSRTTAHLQRWRKGAGGGWWRVGPLVTAHLGSQGMTRYPSESMSATPMGSFTLTRAFGRYADPGTALPYTHTTPADWWISQSGALYNTLQHCSANCPFTRGSPNEHLYYTTPYYNYAVVIDYNTRNAGPVRQGAGSAFFLHVSVGSSTAGCIAIPSSSLQMIMRWLTPGTHPRILVGTS